jgi:hypothetical protein
MCQVDKPRRREQPSRLRVRGACATVVTLLVAVAVTLISLHVQCDQRSLCGDQCVPVDDLCGFETRVSAGVLTRVGASTSLVAMRAADRGVCRHGTRQCRAGGALTCRRADFFPSALAKSEIGDSSGDRPSTRSCGAWTSSWPAPWPFEERATVWWAFFDEATVRQEAHRALHAQASVGASSALQTFGRACLLAWSSNTVGQSVRQAHAELVSRALPAPVETTDDVVRAMGVVAGHFCSTPVALSLGHTRLSHADEEGGSVRTTLMMLDGTLLSAESVEAALRAVDASPATVVGARLFASSASRALRAAEARAEARAEAEVSTRGVGVGVGTGARATAEVAVVAGALGLDLASRESIQGLSSRAQVAGELPRLQAVLDAVQETDLDAAASYVRGLAAACASSAGVLVSRAAAPAAGADAGSGGRTGAVRALGRLPDWTDDRMPGLGPRELATAGMSTFNAAAAHASVARAVSSRRRFADIGFARGAQSAEDTCADAAATVFTDHTERAVYELFVGSVLEQRVKELVPTLRDAVARTITSGTFRHLFTDGGARFASAVRRADFRIAGAPTGVFSDQGRDPTAADVTSVDRSVSILVKQARELFLSRADAALEGDRCDIPALMPSTSRNAYYLIHAECVVLLPGLLVGPFAGRSYDDESLVSRLGYVIAHEFAHATSDAAMWRPEAADFLSRLYPYESTYYEGLADVVAVAAVASTNLTTRERLCEHVSELWCGLEGTVAASAPLTHPPVNARGDALCAFLRSEGRV